MVASLEAALLAVLLVAVLTAELMGLLEVALVVRNWGQQQAPARGIFSDLHRQPCQLSDQDSRKTFQGYG